MMEARAVRRAGLLSSYANISQIWQTAIDDEVESRLAVLMEHLLKWTYQPEKRTR